MQSGRQTPIMSHITQTAEMEVYIRTTLFMVKRLFCLIQLTANLIIVVMTMCLVIGA